jgi:hypothetical protein
MRKHLEIIEVILIIVIVALLLSVQTDFVTFNDHVRISTPLPDQKITSPLLIKGEARGTWFFEADFPVILTNWDGLIIAEHYATAEGKWMTESFVPFTATLEFEKPEYGERGTLILQKSNPTGFPEFDDAVEISILF